MSRFGALASGRQSHRPVRHCDSRYGFPSQEKKPGYQVPPEQGVPRASLHREHSGELIIRDETLSKMLSVLLSLLCGAPSLRAWCSQCTAFPNHFTSTHSSTQELLRKGFECLGKSRVLFRALYPASKELMAYSKEHVPGFVEFSNHNQAVLGTHYEGSHPMAVTLL